MHTNRDTVEEFWCWSDITAAYHNANEQSVETFCHAFSSFIGVAGEATFPTSSAKSALTRLLKKRKDKRSLVMVSSLNCKRVKDAIEDANCGIKTYDFQYQAGRFDWRVICESFTEQVSVLIVTHLYGVPIDLRKIRDFCNERAIILIEDCAQTLGGYVDGQQVGTWGDAAIFSFSYDKPISLGWGGMAVINSPGMFLSEALSSNYSPQPNLLGEIRLLRDFCDSLAIRRSLIKANPKGVSSLARRIYKKFSRSASFDQYIAIGAIQAELGISSLERFPKIRSIRNSNARLFAELCPLKTWLIMTEAIEPAWLKQKVFIPAPKQLESISRELRKSGIRAGNFNWPRLMRDEDVQTCPIASQVTTCWMDIPIHQEIGTNDIEAMVSVINKHG